jgi:hypothetical protein
MIKVDSVDANSFCLVVCVVKTPTQGGRAVFKGNTKQGEIIMMQKRK